MARLLLPPGYPVFGSDGELSAAAEAFFYETGTTTDKTVYQDEALTTPHAQPVAADANGIIAGGVYGDESEDYKVTFKTSGGSTLRTIDPIPDLAVALADLATGTRGDLIAMGASAWSSLAIGAADRLLSSDGTDPSWGQLSAGMVPDNLITLAMLAHQTAGDLPYYGASGAPSLLNIGTANQMLRVNSGGTAPEWATVPVFTTFTSSEIVVATGNQNYSAAHSLSAVPQIVIPVLVCKTADLNYSVGNEVAFPCSMINSFGGSSEFSASWGADATNCFLNQDSGIILVDASTGAQSTITYANWRLKFYALRFA